MSLQYYGGDGFEYFPEIGEYEIILKSGTIGYHSCIFSFVVSAIYLID